MTGAAREIDAVGSAQESAVGRDAVELIRRCLGGEVEAWQEFQALYGEIIYAYPVRAYRLDPDLAADFYAFAFENGRLFSRLRSYEGRAPLRAFLLGYVLDTLVIDWRRTQHRLSTISLDDLDGGEAATADGHDADSEPFAGLLNRLLASVEPSKRVVMKLLHVEDAELSAEEIQYIARASGQRVVEVIATIERLRESVRERESEQKQIEEALDAVHAWVQLYEQRLSDLRRDRGGRSSPSGGHRHAPDDRAELELRLQRRQQQRTNLQARLKGHRVTVAYKDIAELLNTTTGNVGSLISRMRQELQRRGMTDFWANPEERIEGK